jgi:hypothetical protein
LMDRSYKPARNDCHPPSARSMYAKLDLIIRRF